MLLLVFSWQIAGFCLVTMPAMLRAANKHFYCVPQPQGWPQTNNLLKTKLAIKIKQFLEVTLISMDKCFPAFNTKTTFFSVQCG